MFQCILCHSSNFSIENNTIRNISKADADADIYKILKCSVCNHVQLYPIPSEQDLKIYYDNDMQVNEILSINNREKTHYIEMLKNESLRRIDILEKNIKLDDDDDDNNAFHLIDIGGGTCEFVKSLKTKYINMSVSILEPGISRINEMGEENINKINNFLDDDFSRTNKEKFNVVTAFHVLEHVVDPIQFIKNCVDLLKEDGLLYIEVPNQHNELIALSDYYKNNIWYCKAHISYFTKEIFTLMFDKLNITDYSFYAYERYDYENYLHWIKYNKPQHISTYYKGINLDDVEEVNWIKQREQQLTSDAIYVIIRKKSC